MNTKMIEYQLFTKCNLKCQYCYNYFDQTVYDLDTHINDLRKISSLADRKTCMVLNGGEPLLLKEMAALINSVEVDTNIITYTNGALPIKVYEKFVNELDRLDNLYFTISVHYAELLRTGSLNEDYKNNVKYLVENIPNLKVNIVFTEDFADPEFVMELSSLMLEFHSYGLKYVNVLLQDELKADPVTALKLVRTEHFNDFFEDMKVFQYKHCMWNNKDTDVSCLVKWIRKEVMSPPLPYKELSFLRYGDGFVFENNFGFKSEYIEGDSVKDIDALIEDVRPHLV